MDLSPEDLTQRGMSARLTEDEWSAVCECCTEVRSWNARSIISRKGEPLTRSLLLVEGLVARHVPGPYRDLREMVALEVPGDFVDLHCFPIGTLDHDVTAITDVHMAVLPHDKLRILVEKRPDIGIALWGQTVLDASINRYWAFRVGALRATGRLANLLCELHARLDRAGMVKDNAFDLALTQSDLGEACGLSTVHVNRVIRELREAGCCTIKDGRVAVHDLTALHRIGHFDPYFLEMGSL